MQRQLPYQKSLGFTLIEVLVVVSLVGTLSTVAMVSVNEVRMMVRDAQRLKELDSLATALEMYYQDHDVYPASTRGICNTSAGDVSRCPPYAGLSANLPFTYVLLGSWNSSIPLNALATNGYIHKLPVDPLNRDGYWYAYRSSPDNQGYVILALKETGGGILKIGGPMGGEAWRDVNGNGFINVLDAQSMMRSCGGSVGNTPETNAVNGCDQLLDFSCSGLFELPSPEPDETALQRFLLGYEMSKKNYCPDYLVPMPSSP